MVSIRGGVERCAVVIGGADFTALSVANEGDDTPALSFASCCSLPLGENSFDASSEFLRRRAKARLRLMPLLVTAAVKPFAGVGGCADEDDAAADGIGGVGLLWLRPICKWKWREERVPMVATRCCCWAAEDDERAG